MRRVTVALVVAVVSACSAPVADESVSITRPGAASTTTESIPTTTPQSTTTSTMATTTTTAGPFARPEWLGTRPLPLRLDGHGVAAPTPDELVNRRLETIDILDPPGGDRYVATIEPIPDDVLARSSWVEDCPVGVEELRYLTMTHLGFDGKMHTGEMIVNAAVAEDVVSVFEKLFEAGFPIEQMRVVRRDEIDDPPTGDWNETTSFVCRPAVGSTSWSYHAYGLAIDVNPFHNPYLKGDLVIPELASTYTDRSEMRPGMIVAGDVVTEAFVAIGWEWGGNWNTLKDWMHFSSTGR